MAEMGRPTDYSLALCERICAKIARGKSLVYLTRLKSFPCYSTVTLWLRTYPDFSAMYARAREDQADYFADEINAIADGCDGSSATQIAKAKLRIDTRKWTAAKLRPRKYGSAYDPPAESEDTDELDDDNPTLG